MTTVRSLLGSAALERCTEDRHRFCPTPACPVVYFGNHECLVGADLRLPVFCKEPAGNRLVCYCYDLRESDIIPAQRDDGHSPVFHRVRSLVREGRCACEVRNPHGSCCLNDIVQVERRRAVRQESIETV